MTIFVVEIWQSFDTALKCAVTTRVMPLTLLLTGK